MPEPVEAEFDARWEYWLDNADDWKPLFERIEALSNTTLVDLLQGFDLVSELDLEAYATLSRSAEGRAVPLPGVFSYTDADLALLALGFARGEPSALAVPYMAEAAT